jgi:hypothetical protein
MGRASSSKRYYKKKIQLINNRRKLNEKNFGEGDISGGDLDLPGSELDTMEK